MKLHILSDLHTEFADFDLPETNADVVVLAGDVGVGRGALEWLSKQRLDKPVIYVPGNHEFYGHDISLLIDQLRGGAPRDVHVLDNQSAVIETDLTYLPSGDVIDIGEDRERIRVGGIGGCHGPSNYERRSRDLQGWAKRHFTHDECERLSSHEGVDVLLLHDAPAGVEFTWRRKDGSVRRRYQSEAEGLAQAVARAHPRVCFFGHHHTRLDAEIAGVRCIGFNKVAMPGHLVALEVPPRGRGFEILG